MKSLKVSTSKRTELADITAAVQKAVDEEGIRNGIIFLYVPHTTAALTVNENADPSVKKDIIKKLTAMIPKDEDYGHSEGNSDSHIKSSLFGNEMFFFIESGRLALGTWQGIYFAEFDGPRDRQIYIKFTRDL